MAVGGAAGEDGPRRAGGAVVVVGEGDGDVGEVVPPGLAGAVLAGADDGGDGLEVDGLEVDGLEVDGLEVDGLEVDGLGGGGQAFPPVTVTFLRVRFTLAAHAHKLHD